MNFRVQFFKRCCKDVVNPGLQDDSIDNQRNPMVDEQGRQAGKEGGREKGREGGK